MTAINFANAYTSASAQSACAAFACSEANNSIMIILGVSLLLASILISILVSQNNTIRIAARLPRLSSPHGGRA